MTTRIWDTLPRIIEEAASDAPERIALEDEHGSFTYADLRQLMHSASAGFADVGIVRGDRVVVYLPNGIDWIVTVLGLSHLGAVSVLVNTRYRPRELAHIIADSEAVGIIHRSRFLGRDYDQELDDSRQALQDGARPQIDGTELPTMRHLIATHAGDATVVHPTRVLEKMLGVDADFRWVEGIPDIDAGSSSATAEDTLFVIYTSGTTGNPKGSMIRHGAAVASGFSSGEQIDMAADDRLLCFLPLFHSFGAVNGVCNTFSHRATLVLHDEFDAERVLRSIAQDRITCVYGVPTNFLLMNAAYEAHDGGFDLATWRTGIVGGGMVTDELVRIFDEVFGVAGMTNSYGLTETAAPVTKTRASDPSPDRVVSSGRPLPGLLVAIEGPDGTRDDGSAPTGMIGEILINGYGVHPRYIGRSRENSGVDAGGWFHTGDTGHWDENGRLRVLGRTTEMYKSAGFNVYPAEIESQLRQYPGVADAAVIGIPDRIREERGIAFVTVAAGATLDVDEVHTWLRARLANFKNPSQIVLVDELPRNAVGKIQKHVLRDTYQTESAHLP